MRRCSKRVLAGRPMQAGSLRGGLSTRFSKERFMVTTELPRWYAEQAPLYDIGKTYLENALHGPFFNAQIPKRSFPPKEKWIDFLGHKVASPLGVPAGPLLTANWIKLAAALG